MKQSVNEKLESWLQRGYGITQLQALEKWGCMRLGARIHELRVKGMNILTEMVNRNDKTYAKYSLGKDDSFVKVVVSNGKAHIKY